MTDEAKHTPGPWLAWGSRIGVVDPQDFTALIWIMRAFSGTALISDVPTQEANARRIVAVVNACEGIPVEALEAGVVKELLHACKFALDALDGTAPNARGILEQTLAFAIAGATGEAA